MRICKIEGCGRKHSARGYCGLHYWRWREGKRGEALAAPIYASPEGDTERTLRQIDAHNAIGLAVCGWGSAPDKEDNDEPEI